LRWIAAGLLIGLALIAVAVGPSIAATVSVAFKAAAVVFARVLTVGSVVRRLPPAVMSIPAANSAPTSTPAPKMSPATTTEATPPRTSAATRLVRSSLLQRDCRLVVVAASAAVPWSPAVIDESAAGSGSDVVMASRCQPASEGTLSATPPNSDSSPVGNGCAGSAPRSAFLQLTSVTVDTTDEDGKVSCAPRHPDVR
jgi:hypothetical protein